MKKAFILIATMAMLLPLVSCNKNDDKGGNNGQKEYTLPKSQFADYAIKLDLSKTDKPIAAATRDRKEGVLKNVDFGAAGKFIGEIQPIDDGGVPKGKSELIIGDYKISKESKAAVNATYTLTLPDGSTLAITVAAADNATSATVTATVTDAAGASVSYTGTAAVSAPAASGAEASDFLSKVANNAWKVSSLQVDYDGNGVKISKVFQGAEASKVNTIIDWAKGKGVKFQQSAIDQFKGYDISYIIFTEAGGFSIVFTEKPAFAGTFNRFSIRDDAAFFVYTLDAFEEQFPLLEGAAEGMVAFEGNTLGLRINSDPKYGDTTYNVEVFFKLDAI